MPQNHQEYLWGLKDNKKVRGDLYSSSRTYKIIILYYYISHIIFNYPKINIQAKNIVQIPITAN